MLEIKKTEISIRQKKKVQAIIREMHKYETKFTNDLNTFTTDFFGLVVRNYFVCVNIKDITFHCIYPYNCLINKDINTYYIPN